MLQNNHCNAVKIADPPNSFAMKCSAVQEAALLEAGKKFGF